MKKGLWVTLSLVISILFITSALFSTIALVRACTPCVEIQKLMQSSGTAVFTDAAPDVSPSAARP